MRKAKIDSKANMLLIDTLICWFLYDKFDIYDQITDDGIKQLERIRFSMSGDWFNIDFTEKEFNAHVEKTVQKFRDRAALKSLEKNNSNE
jgi:hypothetical protein